MALRLVGSRDQTAFTLSDNGDAWAAPSESRVPWAEAGSSIRLAPGRYRIDTVGARYAATYSVSPWASTGDLEMPTAYLETHESGTRLYFRGGGTVFITRLA
ncbi:hypothetical protein [Corynebacterium sp. HMSC072A04]|uniref:hypothetical protein n=1 Tax=Corynebacterium sp. HMSC072A04 TaxID=1715045 RepID=UPI0008C1C642|nr:hypothetical protein [Corynebacterium sp. HMSC072A04]OFN33604.1 hypothetical protein HMPREF2565_11745 [Corynebacterium sp. HMSC072A04]